MSRPDAAQKKKKQTIILGVLMVVLAVMGVRQFMPQPRKTSAAIKPPAAAMNADAAAKQTKLTPVQLTWPLVAKANPFAANGVYPPKPAPKPVTPPKVEPPPKPEPKITAEQVRDQAAKTLKLQGMILGSVPRAVVNNRPVAAGEEIEGFLIVSIEARRIVVRKNGFDVEVELK